MNDITCSMKKTDFLKLATLTLPLIDDRWNNHQNIYISNDFIGKRKGDTILVKHAKNGKYTADTCLIKEIRHLRLDEISPDIWNSNMWVGKNNITKNTAIEELLKIRFNDYNIEDKLEIIILKPIKLI